jgi:GTP-binding protein
MQKNKIFNRVLFISGISSFPTTINCTLPEVAFWGRSNVGKSSTINALCFNNKIAKISKTPGRTQQINLFEVGNKQLQIADLPGYGYAKTSKTTNEKLYKLCYDYLTTKRAKLFLLLIDARRGFMESDKDVIEALLFYNYQFIIVVTKIDLIARKDLLILQESLKNYNFTMISSKKSIGIKELQDLILNKIS